MESSHSSIPQVMREFRFYTLLNGHVGFPKAFLVGYISHQFNGMVMELLGSSLDYLFRLCGNKFSLKTVLMIMDQLLDRFEYIHEKKIVYRDVKPENFVIGNANSDKRDIIHVIDFGLSKEYVDPSTNQHIPFKVNRPMTGTARYMSINMHLLYEQSRRDDLESLGYMLVYFLRGSLPWQGLKVKSTRERFFRIGEIKRSITLEQLCDGLPNEFCVYFTYVLNLDFFERPDYDYLRGLFSKLFVSKGFVQDNMFDWWQKKVEDADNCQETLKHLQWMLQKTELNQDMFLFGPPGYRRRNLAMKYAELTNSEVEYLALNRDTTEADLKQRREIVNGSTIYFDQCAVRAALKGRTLILDGIEKVERNVLPVLNNLLENREMNLEDGRFLIPAQRFDKLVTKHGEEQVRKWNLERVNENFRVIALGIPVPRFAGNPLDPPLRSRFQVRHVSFQSYSTYLQLLRNSCGNHVDSSQFEKLLNFAFAINESEHHGLTVPQFPIDNLIKLIGIWKNTEHFNAYQMLYRLYPYKEFVSGSALKIIENLLSRFQIQIDEGVNGNDVNYQRIIQRHGQIFIQDVHKLEKCSSYIPIEYQNYLVSRIKETLSSGNDLCLIGTRGCGKTTVIEKVIEDLQQESETVLLYADITARDLLQQRVTKSNGDTDWKLAPLIEAARSGKIAVLDGLHRVHSSTLSVLYRLSHDRECQLHDGRRLINARAYELLKSQLQKSNDTEMEEIGLLRIDDRFRMIALAQSSTVCPSDSKWLNEELLSLFAFHEMRPLTKLEEMDLISAKCGTISRPLKMVIDFANYLRKISDDNVRQLAEHLSTRQLIRIAKRLDRFPNEDLHTLLSNVLMVKFLPTVTRNLVLSAMKKMEIYATHDGRRQAHVEINGQLLRIGDTSCDVTECKYPEKIPRILFYDVPQHYRLMEDMLKDFLLGHHILLVGNQGVGKNKIVDKFLELLNRSREYIQLHRDTTIQTLTIQPTIRDGRLVYDDSPLVRAIKEGHVLVVDEADKAPVHVTSILKNLVESGQMVLSDGRRIVKDRSSFTENLPNKDCTITSHPDFRMIVLANRPGFPFLGNDFFGTLGDLFSCHSVENPPASVEIKLLQNYAPDVPFDLLKTIVAIFDELRSMADQGLINYPFSTREVVHVAKHLQKFPESDLLEVLMNVFDFDIYSKSMMAVITEVLKKHKLIHGDTIEMQLQKNAGKNQLRMHVERTSGLDVSDPKHGKEDPKNEPHIGGNTWAGGTGGRDTAGLGGKGGPYRLDKGHQIHQLSDQEKSTVPEHVQKAAREMGREAFRKKLEEIKMSEYDAKMYEQYRNAVRNEIETMRNLLENFEMKETERIWSRNQLSGDIDDGKLIDGLLGDKNIYRKRVEKKIDWELSKSGGESRKKRKRVRFVVDVSGSMYRFNSYDGRLNRQLELAVLFMESFHGFEEKFLYDIIGHSGDNSKIPFVTIENQPKNEKERLQVLKEMVAHSQYCWSGDNTLQSTEYAIQSLSNDPDCDQAIVIVLSDANLKRYDIQPKTLASVLTKYPKVNSNLIFIGSLGDEVFKIMKQLPPGKAHFCDNNEALPTFFKDIFTSTFS